MLTAMDSSKIAKLGNDKDTTNGAADLLANEILRDDFRYVFEALFSGMNMKDGGKAFDNFCAQATQFLDQITCPTSDVDIEKVAVFDHVDALDCNAMFDTTNYNQDQGQEMSLELLLDHLENECSTDFQKTTGDTINGSKLTTLRDRDGRLDEATLDALAKLLEELPEESRRAIASRTKSRRRKCRDDDTDDSTEVEDFSTRPLPGRRITKEESMPVPVFGFDKLAKEFTKANRQSYKGRASSRLEAGRSSNRRASGYVDPRYGFAKARSQSYTVKRRKPPMIAEDPWEYLDEQTLSSQQDIDPIIAPSKPKPNNNAKKSFFGPMARKLSILNRGKNQFGRHRTSIQKRHSLLIDDDGSVQIDYRG